VASLPDLAESGGSLLIVIAGLMSLTQWAPARTRRLVRRLDPRPVAALTPGRRRIAVEGVTETGPAGRQVAPVTEFDCVWYRTQLLRRPSRHGPGEDAPDHDVLHDISSPDRAGVTDGTGTAIIDPDLMALERDVRERVEHQLGGGARAGIPSRFGEPDIRAGETLVVIEEWIPRHRPVYVLARTGRDPSGRATLRRGRRGAAVFAAGTRASTLQWYREDLATAYRTIGVLLLAGLIILIGGILAG
jgi:hypothetical protein